MKLQIILSSLFLAALGLAVFVIYAMADTAAVIFQHMIEAIP